MTDDHNKCRREGWACLADKLTCSKRLTRRQFSLIACALAFEAGQIRIPDALAQAPKILKFAGWGGRTQRVIGDNVFKEYTAQTGVNISQTAFGDEYAFFKEVSSSPAGTFDLVQTSGLEFYRRYRDSGLLATFNDGAVPTLSDFLPGIMAPVKALTGKLCGVPLTYGVTGIAFNRKAITELEANSLGASLLLDDRFAGRRALFDDMQTRMWFAALQSGQNPNSFSNMGTIWQGIEKVWSTSQHWRSTVELAEMFLSEKVILADAWSNEVALLRDQGLPLGFLIPPNSLAWMELFCVIRGAQLPEVEALLQVLTKPTVLEVVSVAQKLPPSMNPKSHTFSRRVTELPGFDPSGSLSNLAFADANYWSAGNDRWWPDWERIRGSG